MRNLLSSTSSGWWWPTLSRRKSKRTSIECRTVDSEKLLTWMVLHKSAKVQKTLPIRTKLSPYYFPFSVSRFLFIFIGLVPTFIGYNNINVWTMMSLSKLHCYLIWVEMHLFYFSPIGISHRKRMIYYYNWPITKKRSRIINLRWIYLFSLWEL